MLWLIDNKESYDITSCNVYENEKEGMFELWVTRTNNKSIKLQESTDWNVIYQFKDAIDYAMETSETVLRLN